MRNCYYTYDKDVGKILIPGCWPVVHTNDIANCICKKAPASFAQFEKKEYNETVEKLNAHIKELEAEIERLEKGENDGNGRKKYT